MSGSRKPAANASATGASASKGTAKALWTPAGVNKCKGESNAAESSAGNPAEQVLAEELEAPGGLEDGYSTDASLSREMRALGPAIEDVDLTDTEEADVTVEEVAAECQ